MRCGTVVGVTIIGRAVRVVLEDRKDHNRESVVELCDNWASGVMPGDYIWTQSDKAMWTNGNVRDHQLPIHRVDWRGRPLCGCKSPLTAEDEAMLARLEKGDRGFIDSIVDALWGKQS